MTVRGGDIRQFKWNGREYDVAPDSDVTLFITSGGIGLMVEQTPNGNGTPHGIGKRYLGGFDGLTISNDSDRGDFESLVALQSGMVAKACSMTLVNGVTYVGDLLPEGLIQASTQSGQVTVAGRGKRFEKL